MTSSKNLLLLPLAALLAGGVARAQFFSPDLQPTQLIAPSDVFPGETAAITSTIVNNQFFPSAATTSSYYLSEDSAISSSDILLTSWTTPSLSTAINPSHTITRSVTFPPNTPAGASYIAVWANRSGASADGNPGNNIRKQSVMGHGKPDLSVTSVAASGDGKWARGEEVSVTARIENGGGIVAFGLNIAVYLGTTLLDSWNQEFLDEGEVLSISRDVTIPMDAVLGDCSISVAVNNQLPESDLSNNQQWITGTCFLRGSFVSYGEACPGGNGLPSLTASDPVGDPIIGSTSTYELRNGPSNFYSVMLFGFSDAQFGQLPLPLRFDGFGAPGCALLSSADISLNLGTDVTGYGSVVLPMPDNPDFIGRRLHVQVMSPDPGANALGWIFSNALRTTLGSKR